MGRQSQKKISNADEFSNRIIVDTPARTHSHQRTSPMPFWAKSKAQITNDYRAVKVSEDNHSDADAGLGADKKRPDKPMFNQSEINVLIWCANGKTSYEIGKILSLSEHTINHYINLCVKKLSASNRIHAVAKAIKLEIIDLKDIS